MKTQTAKKHEARKAERISQKEKRQIAVMGHSSVAPRLKVLQKGSENEIDIDHPDVVVGYRLLAKALGTSDTDFLFGILKQLSYASIHGDKVDEGELDFLLAVVKGISPKDQLETMLAAQMAVVHMATMKFARRLANVDYITQQDSAERALNKLLRTFASQMEALKRYRTGGEQKVTVQHVSVAAGGQAIVGNVAQSPREEPTDKPATSPPSLTDARNSAVPILEENKEPVPVAARRRRQK